MIKALLIIFVTVVIFTGTLYTWLFAMLGDYIILMTTDFLPFVPMEFRLGFFLVLLWLIVALWKSFIS